jgi:iron complex outermembrane receptor protein
LEARFFSLCFSVLCFFTVNAQYATLKGIIADAQTGEPLIGATVILRSDPSIGAVSNINGVYSLNLPPGTHTLVCRFTGMVSDTLTLTFESGKTVQHNFALRDNLHTTGVVEIKVGKFDRRIEELTVSMEVIKPEIIENKNTRSIETILDQTPGLNILDGEPQIRGGSGFTFGVGSKVAVIVDDMPMLSGDAGRPEWGFIPVENIEQIEVIKGASSVLSGTSALSGAIHIRTAYPKDKPLTKINVYSGAYTFPNREVDQWSESYPGIHGVNFLHSRKVKQWDLVVGANLNYDHGYIGPPRMDSVYIFWTDPPAFDTISNFSNRQMASYRARTNFNLRRKSKKISGLAYGLNGNVMFSQSVLSFAWLNDSTGLYRAYPGAAFLQDQFIGYLDPFIQFFQHY